MAAVIYGLTAGGSVRYVGVTTQPLGDRLSQHRYDATRPRYRGFRVYQWMNEVGRDNVELIVLDSVAPGHDPGMVERGWIQRLLAEGYDLTNFSKSVEHNIVRYRGGCRCDSCRAANRDQMRRYRARARVTHGG